MSATSEPHPAVACLPLVTAGPGCGYCNGPLTLQPAGHWRCEPCQPLLAAVNTEGDWILMHRAVRRRRVSHA